MKSLPVYLFKWYILRSLLFPKDSIRLWEGLLQTLSPLQSQVRLKRGCWPLLYQRWPPVFLPLIQRWSLSVKRRKSVPMVHFHPGSFFWQNKDCQLDQSWGPLVICWELEFSGNRAKTTRLIELTTFTITSSEWIPVPLVNIGFQPMWGRWKVTNLKITLIPRPSSFWPLSIVLVINLCLSLL